MRRFRFLLVLGVVAGSGVVADFGPDKSSSKMDQGQMEAWWADLEKGEAEASRALLNLSTQPEQAVAFLKDRIKPLLLDSVRLKAYLLRLGSSNEALWKQAFEDLEYYDPRLAMDLPTLMDKVTETPARQRMVEVLSSRNAGSLKDKKVDLRKVGNEGYNFFDGRGSWWAEHKVSRINTYDWDSPKKKWTRAVRAIVLLEHIGTPDAVAILKDMATGHPEAQPTRVAKESLERLASKAH